MAITVEVRYLDSKQKTETIKGDNLVIEGPVLKIFTEPHEVVPEGQVDLFIGKIIPLMSVKIVDVRRI